MRPFCLTHVHICAHSRVRRLQLRGATSGNICGPRAALTEDFTLQLDQHVDQTPVVASCISALFR
jgi:hypothetical protein